MRDKETPHVTFNRTWYYVRQVTLDTALVRTTCSFYISCNEIIWLVSLPSPTVSRFTHHYKVTFYILEKNNIWNREVGYSPTVSKFDHMMNIKCHSVEVDITTCAVVRWYPPKPVCSNILFNVITYYIATCLVTKQLGSNNWVVFWNIPEQFAE